MKKSGDGNKKKDLLSQSDMLAVFDLIAATSPRQGLTSKSFNGKKLKLPSFLSLTVPLSTCDRQDCNPCLSLHENYWENIKSTSTFACTCSTKDLVSRANTESKKVLESAPCASSHYFCHGAHTQMSNANTTAVIRMKDQDTGK